MRGKSRQALHRMEKLADEEVEPPEFVTWMLALQPLPEARGKYEKYLERKAARDAEAATPMPEQPAQPVTLVPAPVPPVPVAVPIPAPGATVAPATSPTQPAPSPPVVSPASTTLYASPELRRLTAMIAVLAASVALLFVMQLLQLFGGFSFAGHLGDSMTDVQMGQNQARRVIPAAPFKWQKRAPCDDAARQVLLNGGCWYGGAAVPCAPKEYEHEGRCYLPVAAIPTQPVAVDGADGGTPDPPP
jgi:hypothetical protein